MQRSVLPRGERLARPDLRKSWGFATKAWPLARPSPWSACALRWPVTPGGLVIKMMPKIRADSMNKSM